VHGTNPVGSLLKMPAGHYPAWIPLDPGNTAVITSLRTTHMNNLGSPGFVDDERWTLRSLVASLLYKQVDK